MGFWAIKPNSNLLSLTTTMSSGWTDENLFVLGVKPHRFFSSCFLGFVTVEEGYISGDSIELKLKSIARISFGRDLQVTDVIGC